VPPDSLVAFASQCCRCREKLSRALLSLSRGAAQIVQCGHFPSTAIGTNARILAGAALIAAAGTIETEMPGLSGGLSDQGRRDDPCLRRSHAGRLASRVRRPDTLRGADNRAADGLAARKRGWSMRPGTTALEDPATGRWP
jgi:hypothetical protein